MVFIEKFSPLRYFLKLFNGEIKIGAPNRERLFFNEVMVPPNISPREILQ